MAAILSNAYSARAMDTVYRGYNPAIQRQVAIKTSHGALRLKEEAHAFMERFKREAQAAGRLFTRTS